MILLVNVEKENVGTDWDRIGVTKDFLTIRPLFAKQQFQTTRWGVYKLITGPGNKAIDYMITFMFSIYRSKQITVRCQVDISSYRAP